MKVVILAGGMGTRLKEETEFKPKPLVNVGGRPILWHIMKIYAYYGFNDFIIALGYKGWMIKEYFYNYAVYNTDFTIEFGNNTITFHNNLNDNWKVTLVDTGEHALKGARLKRIEKFIPQDDENFMVTYGDGVSNVNIKELLNFHIKHGKIATLTGVKPIARFGELEIDGEKIVNFSEKPQTSGNYINGGFFVFKRKILEYLYDRDDCDLEYGTLERLASEGELMVYKHEDFWYCVDTLRDLEYLNKLYERKEAKWMMWEK
ncbi:MULTISPECIES: glucose-1-phosphate cytidylyltransferase [Thermodesulfovibrio]|uniref:glucose-1-phosphate cytidylyltransferase n=1 Tax=Thermodesulfovibrio yellowstonii TaxID=28262 RepID=UPI000408234A|nr:glucose-1-phosphate cytidylyltransferase [Thermodesulfovibrio islandicus]